MRLDELVGTRRYAEKSMHDWLKDFFAAGGEFMGAGKYATVIGHPRWNYVYKFFSWDGPYVDFVNWSKTLTSPHVPKFLGPIKEKIPFWRRHRSESFVSVVKMERLDYWNPVAGRDLDLFRHLEGSREMIYIIGYPDKEREYIELNEGLPHARRTIQRYTKHWAEEPALGDLCQFYWEHLVHAPIEASHDLHIKNVMKRPDGTLVFTDPFWEGQSPTQIHDEMMRAETGGWDDEPDERDYVSGRQPYVAPPKPNYSDYKPSGDDIPF